MVRRFAMMALSLSMLFGLTGAHHLFAQVKKDEPKKEAPKAEAPKAEAPKKEATKAEEPLPPIPPDVQKKIDAAWKAIAEAVVAAEDAGLVKSSIKPAPVLDILITGRATDEAAVKARTGVSPEVFGAWFTHYGQVTGVTPQNDIRIIQPSAGLQTWYDQRAAKLNAEIDVLRKAKPAPAPAATPAPTPAAPKPAATPAAAAPKADAKKK
jgi:hypothetical protein